MTYLPALCFLCLFAACQPTGITSPEDQQKTPLELIAAANERIVQRDFGGAHALLDSAAVAGADDADSRIALERVLSLANIDHAQGNYEAVVTSLRVSLETWGLAFPTPDSSLAMVRLLLGRTLTRQGNFLEAGQHLERALDDLLLLFGEAEARVGTAYHYRGLNYHEDGKLDEALQFYGRALESRIQAHGKYSRDVAATYNNIGNIFWHQGRYQLAFETHENALSIKTAILDSTDIDIAISISNLGLLVRLLGDLDKAAFYGRKAVRLQTLGGGHPLFLAKAQLDLASHLMEMDEPEEAISLLEAAKKAYDRLLRPGHPSIGVLLTNLGTAYLAVGDSERAEIEFGQGLSILTEADYPRIAVALIEHASALRIAGFLDRADSLVSQAPISQPQRSGMRSPWYLRAQNLKARLACTRQHWNRGEELAQAAILANTGGGIISRSDPLAYRRVISIRQLLDSHEIWADCVTERIADGHVLHSESESVVQKFENAFAALSNGRSKLLFADRQEDLNARVDDMAQAAFKVSLGFHRSLPTRSSTDLLYRFSERAHAGVLQDALRHSRARSFARIPDTLIARERQLREELHKLERNQARWLIENPTKRFDGQELTSLRYAYEDSLGRVIEMYNVGYPRYHAMRYSRRVAPISEVRDRLGRNRDLIEYTVAADSVFAIVITGEGESVVAVAHASELARDVDAFLAAIQMDDFVSVTSLGHSLFRQLIEPIEETARSASWVIVPDGAVLNLPFEALITQKPEDWGVSEIPYLIRDKSISYAYSATLFAQDHTPLRSTPRPGALFAAAPVFVNGIDIPSDILGLEDGTTTTTFEELRGTAMEAVALDRLFDRYRRENPGQVTISLADQATESEIKSTDLTGYRFVHFATHGHTNSEQPSLSGLILGSTGDDEDGVLHVGEVLGLSLDADLVVLSACRTGVETNTSGQGMVGLGRAFMYAGAKSLVVSLWNSSDTYSVATMTHFYDGLLQGDPMAASLRSAKLTLMEDPEVAARPSLWASFVLLADADS